MRILFIISSVKLGGAQRLVLELARKFSVQENIELKIVSLNEGELYSEFKSTDSRFLCFKEENLVSFSVFFKLYKVIADFKPDIVHTHLQKADFYGRIVARFLKVPVILTTCHSTSIVHLKTGTILRKLYEYIDNITASYTRSRVIAISHSVKDWLVKRSSYFNKFTVVIHNGINFDSYVVPSDDDKNKIRSELEFKKEDLIITFVGRVEYSKGIDFLIDNIEDILKENLSYKLLIVGNGVMFGEMKKKAESLSVKKQIRFLGFRKDVHSVLSISDIVVVPSRWEGFGNIILEAMYLGKIVYCSNVGGIPEIVRDNYNGFLFEMNNPCDFKSKLLQIIDKMTYLSEISEKAHIFVKEKYSIDRVCRDYLYYYNELLNTV